MKFLCITGLIIFFACITCSNPGKSNSSQQQASQKPNENWTVVLQGSQCSIHEIRNVLIKSESEFETEWANAFKGMDMPPEKPKVDFTRSWLVAVYMGEKMNGGFKPGIRSVVQEENALKIDVIHIKPGPNCMTSMAIEYPFLYAVIGRFPVEKTEFSISEEVVDCN
jgi:hypothetical protein